MRGKKQGEWAWKKGKGGGLGDLPQPSISSRCSFRDNGGDKDSRVPFTARGVNTPPNANAHKARGSLFR